MGQISRRYFLSGNHHFLERIDNPCCRKIEYNQQQDNTEGGYYDEGEHDPVSYI